MSHEKLYKSAISRAREATERLGSLAPDPFAGYSDMYEIPYRREGISVEFQAHRKALHPSDKPGS